MSHLGVYLTNDKNVTVELPVAPEEVKLALERNDSVVEILKIGEVNTLGEAKLKEIEISSSFPVNPKSGVHVITAGTVKKSDYYLQFIEDWWKSKKAGKLTISTTKINVKMTVDSFEYGFEKGNADEYVYTLKLKEWRDYGAVVIPVKKLAEPTPPPPPPRPAPPAQIGIGSTVIVNGQLFVDSYGNGGGVVEKDAKRKINFTALGRPKPYHCTTLDGSWRGWISADSVRLA